MSDVKFNGKIMNNSEMYDYIASIGRCELYDELDDIYRKDAMHSAMRHNYPIYLKAIRVSLYALGYDPEWLDTTFRDALDDYYLKER